MTTTKKTSAKIVETYVPSIRRKQHKKHDLPEPKSIQYLPSRTCTPSAAACTLNITNPCRLPAVTSIPIYSSGSIEAEELRNSGVEEYQYGPSYRSPNQALVGQAAPRTAIPPVLVDPIFADSWKETDLVVRPGINSETNEDLSSSGYIVSGDTREMCGNYCGETACCGSDIATQLLESSFAPASGANKNFLQGSQQLWETRSVVEGFSAPGEIEGDGRAFADAPGVFLQNDRVPVLETPYTIAPFELSKYSYPNPQMDTCQAKRARKSEVDYTYRPVEDDQFPGSVLVSDGYHPLNVVESNLPSNESFGQCQRSPGLKEYNEQLYTVPLQPGVSTRNEIIEPISSNIGISFTQQFEPITCDRDCQGNITYIGHDPHIVPSNLPKGQEKIPYDRQVHLDDIYDPRFTGYGTSYRSYIEPVTGQPRFYYGDIDTYKRPSYLSRSNVDFLPSSIGIQPIPNSDYFEKHNRHSRSIANEAFIENTTSFRTDLQERLMRKANANRAQSRMYPKYTNGFNRGSMSGRGS